MKTIIFSAFSLESQYIKDALSELQICNQEGFSWHTGKFYTKELYLVENSNNIEDIDTLLDLLLSEIGNLQVITIGLGTTLNEQLREGDILIADQPLGSCQKLVDLFLDATQVEDEAQTLRIFVGQICNNPTEEKKCETLACLDKSKNNLLTSLLEKGLPTLNIRVIVPEVDEEKLAGEIYSNIAQQLLLLLKKAVEQTG